MEEILFMYTFLVGGFTFFNSHPYSGKIPNLTNIFQMGWNHQPDHHLGYDFWFTFSKPTFSGRKSKVFSDPRLKNHNSGQIIATSHDLTPKGS